MAPSLMEIKAYQTICRVRGPRKIEEIPAEIENIATNRDTL
jgi:hypothetical protein